ncbi:hypothetical protein QJ857_gp0970 [Tupanvirus soda lake]|uniref:Uncharacterized protein n=2 Tax=Tupanvirus TaxID=2094720 RepID=A0A6N1NJW0_9VIRU|nr:hypothetical protein QJ857_gp0970 [Tupanvirus soda lake]QKU35084.1 hypothetical protein [Tupanvirus soda lake]
MGNNNTRPENKVDVVYEKNDDPELLNQLYAKDAESESNKLQENIYNKADKLYNDIWDNNRDVYIKRIEIFADPSRGIAPMPYISDKNAYSEGADIGLSSEGPKYIEFIVCKGNLDELINEKHAVHKSHPGHDCGANCECIEQMIEVLGKQSRVYNQTSQNHKHNYEQKQCKPHHHHREDRNQSDSANMFASLSPTSATFSPTSTEPDKNELSKNVFSKNQVRTSAMNDTMLMNKNVSKNRNEINLNKNTMKTNPLCRPMYGGARRNENIYSETSPEEITESEEQTEGAFSATSEMSDTTTSPAFKNTKNNKKNNKKLFDSDEDDDEEETIDTDDLDNNIEDEIDDDDDEDLEGLDEEDITEDGFILEQSDISSTDLYRMQSRLFASETTDDSYKNKSFIRNSRNNRGNINLRNNNSINNNSRNNNSRNNNYKNNGRNVNSRNNDNYDNSTTEKVRAAMHKMNSRKNNLFDSEDMEIFKMNSSTDEYMTKPITRSIKYN